jgi:hypothetical protein
VRIAVLAMLAACGFRSPTGSRDAMHDADDGSPRDGAPDSPPDAPPDAALVPCPRTPTGCTAFACAGSTSCYYVCGQVVQWSAANTRCMANNIGCLVTLDGDAENTCVATTTSPTGNPIWIGYVQTDNSVEPAAGWTWACGQSTFTPSPPWGLPPPNNEPNDSNGDEDCVQMVNDFGHWNDARCSSTAPRYVCEFPR